MNELTLQRVKIERYILKDENNEVTLELNEYGWADFSGNKFKFYDIDFNEIPEDDENHVTLYQMIGYKERKIAYEN